MSRFSVAEMDAAISDCPAWRALRINADRLRQTHLRELFACEPDRGDVMAISAAGLYLDYSKNLVDAGVLAALTDLAGEAGVHAARDGMLRGEAVNTTEGRAALHTALRAPRDAVIQVAGHNVVADVHAVLDRMTTFTQRLRQGHWRGHTGERIRTVVNIGIGGSDLGPRMAYEALRALTGTDITCRFVSNVDGDDIATQLADLDAGGGRRTVAHPRRQQQSVLPGRRDHLARLGTERTGRSPVGLHPHPDLAASDIISAAPDIVPGPRRRGCGVVSARFEPMLDTGTRTGMPTHTDPLPGGATITLPPRTILAFRG